MARRTPLTALALAAMVLGAPSPAAAQIRWQQGPTQFSPVTRGQLLSRIQLIVNDVHSRHVLARFSGPVNGDLRRALKSDGLTLLDYVGDNSYFAVLSAANADAAGLAAQTSLRQVSTIDPGWKTHPDLTPDRVPAWAIVSQSGRPDAPEAVEKTEPAVGLVVAAYVKFHADVDLSGEGVETSRRHGARVRSHLETINGLVIELPLANVGALAAEDAVEWIEPPLPLMGPTNVENRARVGADIAQSPPYELSGAGVTAMVYDSGSARASHGDFGGRLTVRDSSPLYQHSTHVAGTIGGNGSASSGVQRGMAPGVLLESYGFQQPGGAAPGFLYTDPGDLETDYNDAIQLHGANLANNSIGTNVAGNGFPCEWEGNYGLTSAVIDAIARGALGVPLPIIWSAGNERNPPSRCGAFYGTIAPPAGAKNAICVGAVNSNDDAMTLFSGWGPTDDGRLKPDLCAPGCQVGGDNGVTSTSAVNDTAYSVLCGTSMAAPTVTGIAALLLEDFRSHFPERADFRNATLKALLAHTAIDLGNPGPDYQFGYGSVRVVPAIELMRSGAFVEAQLEQGTTYQAIVDVLPGETTLKVTLAWDDAPAAPNVVNTLVNDLDLRIVDPSNVVHFPWTLDPSNPAASAVRTQADHVNNLEQVVVEDLSPGTYRIEVAGFHLPMGPQTFSLCASPRLAACSSKGGVTFGRSSYTCQDYATIQVVDCDLNVDPQVIETTTIHVASTSDPLGLMVTLTETASDSAVFAGSLYTTDVPAPQMVYNPQWEMWLAEQGLDEDTMADFRLLFSGISNELEVTHGDTLVASYVDEDDGQGSSNVMVMDSAAVDCQGPAISNLQVASLGPRRATITFETTEPAYVVLSYGTECTPLSQSNAPGGIRTLHTINLKDLTETTTYHYAVWASDETGNFSIAPGQGGCLSFTTPVVPKFFTEIFENDDNDLEGRSILFTPDGSPDFYTACSEPIASLPTNPAGSTVLTMPDDGPPVPVNLTGGATAWLYGQPYTTFFVSPNGYIVFNVPDTWFLETPEKHFLNPRVSVLFDDLDPTMGGTVSWRQFADRVAVTWLNVPEWFGFNANTFQAEFYFDGRIRVSLLSIDAFDGLTGLSAGGGVSQDFYEMDLSFVIPCDEEAPAAIDESAATPMNTAVDVMLTADDPNNSELTFFITSLPTHGTLRDPSAGVIENVPYELTDGGRVVRYNGYSGFAGADGFEFQAADSYFVSNAAAVRMIVGTPEPVYQFPLDTNPGWTMQGGWAFGKPQGQGGDPSSGATGLSVFGFNLLGHYSNGMSSAQFLTTTPMDCSMLAGTRLRFQRWLGVEPAPGDEAKLEVATNMAPWTPEWQHIGAAVGDTTWTLVDLDISQIADGRPSVRFRWGLGPTDGSGTSFGWNLDDIEIWGVPPGPCNDVVPGDADQNGVVDGRDVAAFVRTLFDPPSASVPENCAADLFVDGFVDEQDLAAMADLLLK